jgi:capsular exopolysaccharide synthesis family protein
VASGLNDRSTDRPGSGEGHYDLATATPSFQKHLIDYLRVLHRRRGTALAVFLPVLVAGIVYAYTAEPLFEGVAQVLIEHENPNVLTLKDTVAEPSESAEYHETQYRILQSRTLVGRTIEAMKAWEHPQLGGVIPGGAPPQGFVARVLSQAAGGLGLAREARAAAAEREPPSQDETSVQSRRIDAFLGRLTIAPAKGSRLVEIRFRSTDPGFAAEAANALANAYIAQNLEFKTQAVEQSAEWLSGQLGEQRRQVTESEAALQKYREQNNAVSLEDSESIVAQKLGELSTMVTRAKAERMQKESVYRQMSAARSSPAALDAFPAIVGNVYIQQIRAELAREQTRKAQLGEKLGPLHPDMVQATTSIQALETKLQAEYAKQVGAAEREYEAALALEQNLVGALAAQQNEVLALNRRHIGMTALQREVASNRQIFESLLQRTREAGIVGEMKSTNVRILDLAEVPRRPVWPDRRRIVLLMSLLGAALAVGAVFFLDYMDDRITTPDEIPRHLGLPFLGLVPDVRKSGGGEPLIDSGVAPVFAEAFRAIRTKVIFAAPSRSRSVVVTSSAPGEGKSLVSSNLAIGLALTGQRVLLIDADMRRSRVHQIFQIDPEPGLSELLCSARGLRETLRRSSVHGLALLPAGRVPDHPAELLSSPRFGELLRQLADHFDWVIVDCPPVATVTDAAVAAHAAAAVLFVVGAEKTSRATARHAVEQLDAADAQFIGAILNRAKIERNSMLYSPYYRREYAESYTPSRKAS